jgi:NADH-quinone oxidoreductase subunit H
MELLQPLIDFLWNNRHWMILASVVHMGVLVTIAYLIYFERKVAAWIQDRIGPNRAGFDFGILPIKFRFWGLGQSFADGIKMLTKEDFRPPGADRGLFTIAPMIMMTVVIVSIAVIPWGGIVGEQKTVEITRDLAAGRSLTEAVSAASSSDRTIVSDVSIIVSRGEPTPATELVRFDKRGNVVAGDPAQLVGGEPVFARFVEGWYFQIAHMSLGVLFILAVLSLAVYGVVVGGYASNNKYSFLGGLRATANIISYEVPLGLAVLTVVILFSTLDLGQIVTNQAGYWFGFIPKWNVFAMPLAFVMFLICMHAEANRAPFDIAEAEQELVGGYHTEYTSMRFGLFYLAEYGGMITTAAVCVALFFGGWHLPYIEKLWPALAGNVVAGNPSITDNILAAIARAGIFFLKTCCVLFIFMWTRWSLPRFRFDQIMNLAWKLLIPISLALFMATAIVVLVIGLNGGRTSNGLGGREMLLVLGANLGLAVVGLALGRFLPHNRHNPNKRLAVPGSRFTRTPLPAR